MYGSIKRGITQGLMDSFMSCRERARLWMEMWEPTGSKRNMLFGELGHLIIEKVYRARMLGEIGHSSNDALKAVETTAWEWSAEQMKTAAISGAAEDIEYCTAIVPAVMHGYLANYTKDFRDRKWLALESEFDVKYQGFRLRGKRDGLFTVKGNTTWIMEHKFKGTIDEATLNDTLALNFQNLFYCLATSIEIGKRVNGVLYDIVRIPQLRLGKGESLDDFAARIGADIKMRPDFYFVRYPMNYPKADQLLFERELISKLEEFRQWTEGDLDHYRNMASCVTIYGKCPFLRACVQGNTVGYQKREKYFPELEEE